MVLDKGGGVVLDKGGGWYSIRGGVVLDKGGGGTR